MFAPSKIAEIRYIIRYPDFMPGIGALAREEPRAAGNGLINSHGAIFAGRDVLATKWNSLNRVSMPHTETRRARLISGGTTVAERQGRGSAGREQDLICVSPGTYELPSYPVKDDTAS